MHVRKCVFDLTHAERDAYLAALLQVKATSAPESNSGDPPELQFSLYDQFVGIHTASVSVTSDLNDGNSHNLGHDGPGFLPWHRVFLLELQKHLTSIDSSVVLPYWDWTMGEATMSRLFQDDFLGAVPATIPSSPEPVASGYFAASAPSPEERPDWWPDGLEGWTIPADLQLPGASWDGVLHRRVGAVSELPTVETIDDLMSLDTYRKFWAGLETGFVFSSSGDVDFAGATHNSMHGWVGGHMSRPLISPFDPIFPLNHCYVDYLWDRWQRDGHMGPEFYPTTQDWDGMGSPNEIPRGHLLDDALYPWIGDATGYETNIERVRRFLPDPSLGPVRRPNQVMDTQALEIDSEFSYEYQPPLVRFSRVQSILDQLIQDWTVVHGRPPNLLARHLNPQFGWANRDQLRDGMARNMRMIESDMIGSNRAEETLLVRILRGPVDHLPRMPHNGPYLEEAAIDVIAQWIDDGCLDNTEAPA